MKRRHRESLYPAIHTLEVVLRNQIDRTLSIYSPYWIINLLFYDTMSLKDKNHQIAILKAQKNIEGVIKDLPHPKKYSSISVFWENCKNKQEFHNILISRLNLGFWITILQNNKLFNNIYNKHLDFAEEISPKLNSRIKKRQKTFYDFLSKKNGFSNRLIYNPLSKRFCFGLVTSHQNKVKLRLRDECNLLNSSISLKGVD